MELVNALKKEVMMLKTILVLCGFFLASTMDVLKDIKIIIQLRENIASFPICWLRNILG